MESKKIDGQFRKKKGFTNVGNSVVRNRHLSLGAKGLYTLIQSFITMPDKSFLQKDFLNMSKEGKKAFLSAWNELKEQGYIVKYVYRVNGGFFNEYDLMDEPSKWHTVFYDKNGNITKKEYITVSEDESIGINIDKDETNNHEACTCMQKVCDTQNGDITKKDVLDRDNTLGNTIKQENNINNTILDNTIDINTINNNSFVLSEKESEEKVKLNIQHDRLIREHPANVKLFNRMVYVVTKAISSGKAMQISKNLWQPNEIAEKLLSLNYDHIIHVLERLPEDDSKIVHRDKMLLTYLFNAPETINEICCSTNFHQHGNNKGIMHKEYDYDEMEKILLAQR